MMDFESEYARYIYLVTLSRLKFRKSEKEEMRESSTEICTVDLLMTITASVKDVLTLRGNKNKSASTAIEEVQHQ